MPFDGREYVFFFCQVDHTIGLSQSVCKLYKFIPIMVSIWLRYSNSKVVSPGLTPAPRRTKNNQAMGFLSVTHLDPG